MNAPTLFTFNAHSVRIVTREGAPWFVATDVATALGYSSPKDAASHLDDDEKGSATVRTPGGPQSLIIINESGLYALVLRSRKPQARKFAKWVTSEVLPAIRQTGSYTAAAKPKALPRPKPAAQPRPAPMTLRGQIGSIRIVAHVASGDVGFSVAIPVDSYDAERFRPGDLVRMEWRAGEKPFADQPIRVQRVVG